LKAIVTGGAGFIGSNLSESLVEDGWEVVVFDNLSSGSRKNLSGLLPILKEGKSKLVIGDCTSPGSIISEIRDCDVLFHFAANPEVRMELNDPEQCFRQNVYATHNILEAFRKSEAKTIVFASTSTIYGEANVIPTPEDYSPLDPISVYGASKLAGEALVGSYCHAFHKRGLILRFANVVGPKSNHGVVSEFIDRLIRSPQELEILGDGTQNKSYMYIDDCIDAVMATMKHVDREIEIFNVGSEDSMSVKDIGITVSKGMGLTDLNFKFNNDLGDGRGWVGDVRSMLLDVTKLKSIGWSPRRNSRRAVEETVKRKLLRLGGLRALKSSTDKDLQPGSAIPPTVKVGKR
jgi:UDP-glucose 4-epimerase